MENQISQEDEEAIESMDNEEKSISIINQLAENIQGKSVAYIKLIKNSKRYTWEIKQLSLDIMELDKINNELLDKFGVEE